MSETKIKRPSKLVKWIFWRIPIFLMIFSAVMIIALKIVEKYPDPLRQGFEQYLSDATGRNATIGKLDKVQFFPDFIIHAKNITVHNRANAAIIDLEIEDVKINTPFSSVFFGGRKINDFSIVNLKAEKDMFSAKEVVIDTANIEVREEGDNSGSFVVGQGRYGSDPLYIEGQLEVRKYNFYIPKNIPFIAKIADYKVTADFKRNITNVSLENTVFSVSDKKSEPANYVFAKSRVFNQDNPLACIFTQENLKECEEYLTTKPKNKENHAP